MTHDKDKEDNGDEFVHFEEEEELRGDTDEILEEESEEAELVISERPDIAAVPQLPSVTQEPAPAKKAPARRARKPVAKKARARRKAKAAPRKAAAMKAKKKAGKQRGKRGRKR